MRAWQDRREVGSSPQALSSRSSSFSSAGVERVEALAHDHVAGGAGAGFLAGMLDLDAVREQQVAERLAGGRLDVIALRAQRGVRQDGELRHRGSAMDLPASARRTLAFMRRAANASVARLSASLAALMARGSAWRALVRGSSIFSSIAVHFLGVESRSPSCVKRRLGRIDQPLRVDALLVQRARVHVVLARARRNPAACARCPRRSGRRTASPSTDASTPRGLLARRHRQQAVGIDLEGDADARRARHHRRDAAQLEARQRAAVGRPARARPAPRGCSSPSGRP